MPRTRKILETAKRYSLNALQLHGQESPGQCRELRQVGYVLIKALPVKEAEGFPCRQGLRGCLRLFAL